MGHTGGGRSLKSVLGFGVGHVIHPTHLTSFILMSPPTNQDSSGGSSQDTLRFRQARDGDHLMTPFQCDWCLFRMLTGRIPSVFNRQDDFLLCLLRRCNLDAFWGREESTVLANRRNLDQLIRLWTEQVGLQPALPQLGPFPHQDVFGVTVAIGMLLKSLQPGRYQSYSQFETMRKLRSAYSNFYHASAQGATAMMTLGRDTAKTFLSTCPTQSLWFERFTQGCLRRMGQEVRQDLAISIKVLLTLLHMLEEEWKVATVVRKESLALVGAYCCIAYGGSFRGHEVFLVDLFGLLKYSSMDLCEDGIRYVIIPLLGRFKNEEGERYHLTPLAYTTNSGIPIGLWTSRLVEVKQRHSQTHGPAFSDRYGSLIDPRWLEMEIMDRLHVIQSSYPDLIMQDINVYEDFGTSRSFRRGATTQARNKAVSEIDIDAMNRWRNVENAKGRKPRFKMQDHYSDIKLMIPTLLRFSLAL